MSNNSFFSARKDARYEQNYHDSVLSTRAYNLIIGGVIAYGLVINYIICKYYAHIFLQMNYMTLSIGYFICAIAGVAMVNLSKNPFISFIG